VVRSVSSSVVWTRRTEGLGTASTAQRIDPSWQGSTLPAMTRSGRSLPPARPELLAPEALATTPPNRAPRWDREVAWTISTPRGCIFAGPERPAARRTALGSCTY
jgi:hypothetical protein